MCEKILLLNITIISDGKTRKNHGLFVNEEGRIADVFSMDDFNASKYPSDVRTIRLDGDIVTPGLIDTHIHGTGGFATDDASEESILGMSEALAKCGVTGFFPTLYAGTPEKMIREAKAILKAKGHEKGAVIEGIHFEGPFLCPEKAGAQDPGSICRPDAETFRTFMESSDGMMKAMTIAPEAGNYDEILDIAGKHDIVLLMGHTNASYDQAKKAIEDGFGSCTHMYNAMSGLNHRNPGVAGAVLFDDRAYCELIADGVHVHKDLVKFTVDKKPDNKVILITDALKPASLGPGTFNANGDEVVLSGKGAFVMKNNPSVLCGSALTLNNAVGNTAAWGIPEEKAFMMATSNPARLYKLKDIGSIAKGFRADMVVWNDGFKAGKTMIDGNFINI